MRLILPYFLLVTFPAMLYAQTSAEAIFPQIHLTDSVAYTEIKDQSETPTCWVFGTNSLLESDLIKKQGLRLNLSEMFIARYAYIDKAKKYIATKGSTYFAGGGQFQDVIRVINRYGIVPEEAYNGRPRKERSHNHAELDTAIQQMVKRFLQEGKTMLDEADLKKINDTLDRYLGKLPRSFLYKNKTYTPKTFAQQVLKFQNDYIQVMSFANLPYYQKWLLDDKYNWAGDSLYNIPLEDMIMLTDTALAKGWSVGWEGDVTESGFNYYKGYAMLTDTMRNYDKERVIDFKSEATERDHMLHLVGAGVDQNNQKWYYMKNSWGTWYSKFNGLMYMDKYYFKLKTIILMVNKNALPQILKEKLGIR